MLKQQAFWTVLLLTSTVASTLVPRDVYAISETEGRRRLLPYIRAFTNCIADEIRARPAERQQAKNGNWKDAVGGVIDYCDKRGADMVLKHDQIFGRGTGINFLKGPYLQDLPRALQARLQSDFDRMDANDRAERAETEERDQKAAAALDAKKKLVLEAVSQHEECIVAALADIAPYSGESALTVVDVALDRCSKFVERRISIGVAAYDMTREEAKTIVDRKVAEMRAKMISIVVTARAEAAKKRLTPGEGAPASGSLPKAQPL